MQSGIETAVATFKAIHASGDGERLLTFIDRLIETDNHLIGSVIFARYTQDHVVYTHPKLRLAIARGYYYFQETNPFFISLTSGHTTANEYFILDYLMQTDPDLSALRTAIALCNRLCIETSYGFDRILYRVPDTCQALTRAFMRRRPPPFVVSS